MKSLVCVIRVAAGRLAGIPGVTVFTLLNFACVSVFALGDEASVPRTVADARAVGSSLSRWIVGIYNHDLLLYGLTVVVVMAAMGFVLGFALDFLISRLGIDLGKLEHRE